MGIRKDLRGKRFGKWTVSNKYKKVGRRTHWLCKCDCGNEKYVYTTSLSRGLSKSCGCINAKYGEYVSRGKRKGRVRIYAIWANIKYRCYTPTAQMYKHYGGKGVELYDEWHSFIAFETWALSHGYSDNLTIDRLDSDGDYCPENCRWITKSENTSRSNISHPRNIKSYWGIDPQNKRHEFKNASEFARNNNLHAGCIRQVATGARKTHQGWTFGSLEK